MPRAHVGEYRDDTRRIPIEIEYDTWGDPTDPTLLLIMGFGAQMIVWEDDFIRSFVAAGFHVVRFDNRDCGLSTHLDSVNVDVEKVVTAALMDDELPPVPYTLSDMAADGVNLLRHLGIDRAHVLGVSMGGMIAQVMAIEHPARIASLISVMSMPGEPETMQSTPEAMEALIAVPPSDRAGYVEHSLKYQVFQSRKYRSDELSRARAAREFDRMYYPEGANRQMAAIYASGRRSEALQRLAVPTLVIHGTDDTLISLRGGERTAELIPGAELLVVADMGHDLPRPLWPSFIDAVSKHCAKVTVTS
jgi:pimeloyl-ACP methyl ester carboxylesterase